MRRHTLKDYATAGVAVGLWAVAFAVYALPTPGSNVVARWVAEDGPELHDTCDTDAQCALTPSCVRDPTCDGGPVNMPRRALVLVGTGCGPDKLVMVAAEEDQFNTTCDAIEAHYLPTLGEK